MLSIKGVFKDGVAMPEKPIEGHNGQSVIITFLEEIQADQPSSPSESTMGIGLKSNGDYAAAVNRDELGKQAIVRHANNHAFERERAAYEQLADGLRDQYDGLYVAMHGGQVVDNDADELKLIERVYERFGYGPVYVRKVGSPLPLVHLPSPRLVAP